jgi:hypothetical protein
MSFFADRILRILHLLHFAPSFNWLRSKKDGRGIKNRQERAGSKSSPASPRREVAGYETPWGLLRCVVMGSTVPVERVSHNPRFSLVSSHTVLSGGVSPQKSLPRGGLEPASSR